MDTIELELKEERANQLWTGTHSALFNDVTFTLSYRLEKMEDGQYRMSFTTVSDNENHRVNHSGEFLINNPSDLKELELFRKHGKCFISDQRRFELTTELRSL